MKQYFSEWPEDIKKAKNQAEERLAGMGTAIEEVMRKYGATVIFGEKTDRVYIGGSPKEGVTGEISADGAVAILIQAD